MKCAFVLLALGCLVTAVHAQWLETTINLPGSSYPFALCYNPENNKVYCANWGSGTVTVIDGATNKFLATVVAGSSPNALCHNPRNNMVYCANFDGHSVTVIDGATDKVIASVPAGMQPHDLCYNPTNNKVYCANRGDTTVAVIDGATDSVVATIGVGTEPRDLAWNPLQNRVYVANHDESTISVLRDSIPSGIEVSLEHQAAGCKPEPTILSGASAARRLASSVVFDAMGRRVISPRGGVYFVREAQAQAQAQAIRKVVIAR